MAVAEVLGDLGFRHLPGLHDQSSHGKKGVGKKVVKAISKAAKAAEVGADAVAHNSKGSSVGPSTHRPARGRDLIGSDRGARLAFDVDREAEGKAYHNGFGLMDGPNGDEHAAAIAARQGFDGKPRVVSAREMDALVASGHEEMFRGVRRGDGENDLSPAEINEALRTGNAYYGHGVYGNGIYATDVPMRARSYADEDSPDSVVRMALHPDARVLALPGDWEAFYGTSFIQEHAAFLEGLDPDDAAYRVFGDYGRYAAAQGYDAIRINHPNGEAETVILNRTALAVQVAA